MHANFQEKSLLGDSWKISLTFKLLLNTMKSFGVLSRNIREVLILNIGTYTQGAIVIHCWEG